MKLLFCITLLLSLFGCNSLIQNSNKKQTDSSLTIISYPDTALENKIMDTLFKLPFVKKSNDYIDSFSHHKYGIAFELDTIDNGKEIVVRAGYNGREDFGLETYYQFNVNSKTLEIKVYDPIKNTELSLQDYIKQYH